MAEKLTLQSLQAFVHTKEKMLETMIIYETRFVLIADIDNGTIRVHDEDSDDAYFTLYDFRSINGEVFVKVKNKPASSGDNAEATAEHKIGAAHQVFSNWTRTQDTYHEFMEKAGKKRNKKKVEFDEDEFVNSWQLTDEDENAQFHSVYKGNLIGYSSFIETEILKDENISSEDKEELSKAIQHFHHEVENEPKAKVIRSLAKIMSWVKERSKKALTTILNEAGKYLLKKGFELAEGKAPQVIQWIETLFPNGNP